MSFYTDWNVILKCNDGFLTNAKKTLNDTFVNFLTTARKKFQQIIEYYKKSVKYHYRQITWQL